jgi:predicted glycosyltransferase
MKRIFFHVQHLLGIGHIRRAAVLARTLAASGFDVLLVSGGAPLRLDIGGAGCISCRRCARAMPACAS